MCEIYRFPEMTYIARSVGVWPNDLIAVIIKGKQMTVKSSTLFTVPFTRVVSILNAIYYIHCTIYTSGFNSKRHLLYSLYHLHKWFQF